VVVSQVLPNSTMPIIFLYGHHLMNLGLGRYLMDARFAGFDCTPVDAPGFCLLLEKHP
jgi:hypothetical protein